MSKKGTDEATLKRCLRYLLEAKPSEKRWRPRSQKGLEYYFHQQWDKKAKQKVEERDQAAITINRVRITINAMLGIQASQPIDPRAKPVGKNDDELADLGTAVVKHIWGENEINDLGIEAFFYQLTYGRGVAYTGYWIRDRDSKSEPVQAMILDPREVTRDPQCKRDDLTDCRYVDWRRRLPLETAQELYPQHAALLGRMVGVSEDGIKSAMPYSGPIDGTVPGPRDWEALSDWNLAQDVDKEAEMVTLHEMWERKWEKGILIEFRDGWKQEYKPDNPQHQALALQVDVKAILQDQNISRISYHVICGNQLLISEPSPYDHGQFPFIFVTNELDHNGDPISEVEYLKDIQDEINHRRSKLLWELSNGQMVIDLEMAARMGMTLDDLKIHAADPRAIFLGTRDQVSYVTGRDVSAQQFQLMQDAKAEMQAVSGQNDDVMGYDSSSKSGIAKDIVRQQGMTLQKPRESKLRGFYKRLTDQLLQLVQQAWTNEKVIRLTDDVGKDKLIALNTREVDPETGMSRIVNDISAAHYEYVIDFDPWTPTAREKVGDVLKDLADKEPDPIARRALIVAAIKALPIPDKGTILDAYAEASKASMPPPQMPQPGVMQPGVPPEPISPYAPQLAA